ncbi:MAG: hypothetical protein ACM3NT_08285 [Methylocystaceae bacterium]
MSSLKAFSKGSAIKFGWETVKSKFWFLVGIYLVVSIINSLPGILTGTKIVAEDGSAFWIVQILTWIISLITTMGTIRISLNLYDNREVHFSDLFNNYQPFLRMLGTTILIGIICMVGFILLVIPGIIAALRLQFAVFLVVDEGLGPVEAIKKSWVLTRGSAWNLFLFWLLTVLVVILGFICLVIGILVAAPVTYLGLTYIYRQLNPGQGISALEVEHPSPTLYEN